MTILGILLSIAIPSFQGMQENQKLEGYSTELATDIQYIRSQAVTNNSPMHLRFGLDAAGTCYVLHTGNTGSCTCSSDGTAQCSTTSSFSIKSVGLQSQFGIRIQANITSILFDPVRGTATPTGSINLITNNGKTIRHVINIMGRTRTCSPQGSVSGYKSC